MLFADFHSFIGHLRCFALFLVLIFLGLFLHLCYFNRFFHLCHLVYCTITIARQSHLLCISSKVFVKVKI